MTPTSSARVSPALLAEVKEIELVDAVTDPQSLLKSIDLRLALDALTEPVPASSAR